MTWSIFYANFPTFDRSKQYLPIINILLNILSPLQYYYTKMTNHYTKIQYFSTGNNSIWQMTTHMYDPFNLKSVIDALTAFSSRTVFFTCKNHNCLDFLFVTHKNRGCNSKQLSLKYLNNSIRMTQRDINYIVKWQMGLKSTSSPEVGYILWHTFTLTPLTAIMHVATIISKSVCSKL